MGDGLGEQWTVAGRVKKKRKTRNEVGKGSDKSDEAEDSNNFKLNKPANIARSDWELVTGIILENNYRNKYV